MTDKNGNSNHLTLDELLSGPPDISDPCDLYGAAAGAAAKIIAENWTEALRDGASLESMLHDVDDTVEILKSWKAHVVEVAAKGDTVVDKKTDKNGNSGNLKGFQCPECGQSKKFSVYTAANVIITDRTSDTLDGEGDFSESDNFSCECGWSNPVYNARDAYKEAHEMPPNPNAEPMGLVEVLHCALVAANDERVNALSFDGDNDSNELIITIGKKHWIIRSSGVETVEDDEDVSDEGVRFVQCCTECGECVGGNHRSSCGKRTVDCPEVVKDDCLLSEQQ